MNESVPPDEPRRVWALASYRSGENTQILALAEALGLPYEVKRLRYRALDFVPGLLRLSTLAGIDRGASSPLSPPSIACRSAPMCCIWTCPSCAPGRRPSPPRCRTGSHAWKVCPGP